MTQRDTPFEPRAAAGAGRSAGDVSPDLAAPDLVAPDLVVLSVVAFGDTLTDLDVGATLAAATDHLRLRRAGEVRELLLAAHWADLHATPRTAPDDPEGGEGDTGAGRPPRRLRDPMVSPGGEGTPEVREHALPELALARECHYATIRALVADALDLRHRLPLTWEQVRGLACEPWVARKVAVLSRDVPLDRVDIVDRAVAAAIAGHAPGTVLEIARAKVVEADPETAAMEKERERHRRYVTLSRSDEHGYRHLIARVTAGDAAWLDAMVDRVADILAARHGHDHHHDELRSDALGWLARPADLLRLLLDHTEAPADEAPADGDGADATGEAPDRDPGDDRLPVWAPEHLDRTVERLASLTPRQLAALRGQGTVFVHLTDTSLRRQAGIARTEGGHGPVLVQALAELLGHADVTVKPVLDLGDRRRVDAYEHPDRLKDHSWATAGGDSFPWTPRTATRDDVDFDHPVPYDPGGPPGQTGPHNSTPLRRRHHRWKTFGGFRCRPAGHGRVLWQTPHGLCYLVDHRGTTRLSPTEAGLVLTAPPGLDIHLGPRLEVAA